MKSIIRNNKKGEYYICGRICIPTEQHHIFGGANRKWSEKYGLKVFLCPYCHRDNRNGVHSDAEKMDNLHRIGQSAFERNHTRMEFMEIFGKNYLEEDERPQEEREK